MRIYHASFPFEIDREDGSTGFYAPALKPLRKQVRDLVKDVVENEPENLRHFTQPLDDPQDGLVTIEICVDIESIETVKITRDVLCKVANGGGGFVSQRDLLETVRLRFRVPAALFEEPT